MIVNKKTLDTFNFDVSIDHNKIEKKKLREIPWCLYR